MVRINTSLEQKRFVINPDSLVNLSILRSTFESLKQKYPHLSGLGFFGSQTKGTARQESDYDVCLFYNSERMSGENYHEKADWQDICDTLSDSIGKPLDRRIYTSSDGLRVDISYPRTRSDILMFTSALHEAMDHTSNSEAILSEIIEIPPTQNLYSRFFLAVGDELYKNRQLVLEMFKRQSLGEMYYKYLMAALQKFERGSKDSKRATPLFDGLPKSITEAEEYFILRDRSV